MQMCSFATTKEASIMILLISVETKLVYDSDVHVFNTS